MNAGLSVFRVIVGDLSNNQAPLTVQFFEPFRIINKAWFGYVFVVYRVVLLWWLIIVWHGGRR
jgi:hypothetical protein